MSRAVHVIYDDREPPPPGIEAMVGAPRFSALLRRRTTLGETVRRACLAGGAQDLSHLVDERDARLLAESIENGPAHRVFLRLPSCLVPTVPGSLEAAVRKARYALDSILLAPPEGDEAAALLLEADALAVLLARTPPMPDPCRLSDLRRPDAFLRFMGDATEARHFNTTSADGAVFRKSSTDREKMAREHGLFHVAPERMKPFLVPTFDHRDDGKAASYGTERLNIPDAALQLIHGTFDPASFAALLDRFFDFLHARPLRPVGVAAARNRARTDILGKMQARLDAVLCAAGPMGGIAAMRNRAEPLIEAAIGRDRTEALAVGHGDPCFSNILFDRRIALLRLIDPRGARTLDEAWMHPPYDLAKFSHSAVGGYDFVNNDLFDVVLDRNLHLVLTLDGGGPPAWCRALLTERMAAEGHDPFVVRAYELSLFLSMLPLHRDHPRKLPGFALIAAGMIMELEAMR